jgi:hypothetical protein
MMRLGSTRANLGSFSPRTLPHTVGAKPGTIYCRAERNRLRYLRYAASCSKVDGAYRVCLPTGELHASRKGKIKYPQSRSRTARRPDSVP